MIQNKESSVTLSVYKIGHVKDLLTAVSFTSVGCCLQDQGWAHNSKSINQYSKNKTYM